MFKQTLRIISLLSLLTGYAQTNSSNYKTPEIIPSNVPFVSNEIPLTFNNYYEGFVDGKYPISLSINNLDDNITAVYKDYYQKDAIQLQGDFNYFGITFYANRLQNTAKSHTSYDIMSIEVYNKQTLIIRSHYLNKAINTVLTLKSYPENYAYISKYNTEEFIEQARINTQKGNEFDIQALHKTQWHYPYITHTNANIEQKINQKIQGLVVHSTQDFKTTQEEIAYRQKNNLQTTLQERFVYAEPNRKAWDILINSLPPDSLYYSIHNIQIPYIANHILQVNSNSLNWSGELIPPEYETKLINTQSGDYITFEECLYPEAKDLIYTYLIQNHWNSERIDKEEVEKMFGINNSGISYQFYEPTLLNTGLQMNTITIPFKLLNKYIKKEGPLGVFKR